MTFGVIPNVNITKNHRDAKLVKVRLQGQTVDSQKNKEPKKSGGKGSVALWKNSKHFGCVFQNVEPRKSKIYGRHQTLGTEAKRASPIRYVTPREKLGKKGSFARCDSEHWYS